ncbi:MAG: DUF3644 domain-containing protein [Geminicoccaceae bacterium]
MIKAMLVRNIWNDQDILSYFTRPTRSINHARILEIRSGARYKAVKAATENELNEFLGAWPNLDPETGLNLRGDELLIKARDAMIAAVQVFNGAGVTFRAELFIVTSIIAWTYLFHAWFRSKGIDYRHKNKSTGETEKTKQGAERYWELGKCLRHPKCPLSSGAIKNLHFLLGLRHEIEYRSTYRIDDAVSAKLQACCINFNETIKSLFGAQYNLEQRLTIALQFVTFAADQRSDLKKQNSLPSHVEAHIDAFEHGLTEDEYADPAYRYRVAFVPFVSNRASSADAAIEFVKSESEEGREINRVLLKEVEKPRYTATQVLSKMHEEGYPRFNKGAHTKLWQQLDAKNPALGYGRTGDYKRTWVWHERWLERVRAHCYENADRYQQPENK